MRSERIQKTFRGVGSSFFAGLLVLIVQGIVQRTGLWVFFVQPKVVTLIILGALLLLLNAILFYLKRFIGFFQGAEAIVVSALVFDADKVLLVREETHGRHRPWLLPPAAHLLGHTALTGPPHQAVINGVKEEAGIDIQIDSPEEGATLAATQLPKPFFVQSENQQWRWEGHATHHNFYYIGHLLGDREVTKVNAKYEWVGVSDLNRIHIPKELVKVIGEAAKLMRRKKQR